MQYSCPLSSSSLKICAFQPIKNHPLNFCKSIETQYSCLIIIFNPIFCFLKENSFLIHLNQVVILLTFGSYLLNELC